MLVDEFRACKWGRITLGAPAPAILADFADDDERSAGRTNEISAPLYEYDAAVRAQHGLFCRRG